MIREVGFFKFIMSENIVTEVKLQNKNKNRVNVYINDEFSFSCSKEIVYSYNICKGKSIDLSYLKSIIEEDNYIKCKSAALRIIERNYKTEKQIKDKLTDKLYDAKTIERTVDFLKEYKFIDDFKFVKLYIEEKINRCGKKKIKYDLIKKGISEHIIEDQFESIDIINYEENALKLAKKKYDSLVNNGDNGNSIYRKLGNYLVRNGYDSSLVKKMLNKTIDKEKLKVKENIYKKDIKSLYEIAKKRYNIIIKSENNINKITIKLSQYLMRRGYLWEEIKPVLKKVLEEDI